MEPCTARGTSPIKKHSTLFKRIGSSKYFPVHHVKPSNVPPNERQKQFRTI